MTKSVYSNGEVTNNGVFFFPVWRNDSIVKSQNVTVGIPDSLKLTKCMVILLNQTQRR